MIDLVTVISFLYASTGIISTIGYFPTIRDLLKRKKSANTNSYIIWTSCAFFVFLYALLVIQDLLLEIVTGLNFLFCSIILLLVLRLK